MAPDDTAEPKATVDPPLPPPEEEGSESPFSSGGGPLGASLPTYSGEPTECELRRR